MVSQRSSIFMYGDTPVPYTTAWSAEEHFFVAQCQFAADGPAICQTHAQGQGQPQGQPKFGKPHSQRQREAIANALCDLCGKPLKRKTRVSLSHARPFVHGAQGLAILQTEPLLHRPCARTCLQFCPSLRRDIKNDTLTIRHVTRSRAQCAIIAPEHVSTYVPNYNATPDERIAGHAKVELLQWRDRDALWLDAD